MIFTPQCLVSRYNLAKIDPININSKQLYCPHFGIRCIIWRRTQNILSGNKVEIDSESIFYWHHVPQDEILQNIETRGRSKLRPRLHGWGRILLQIAVPFARVHRKFCTVSALEWLFWITPQGCIEPIMLYWVQIAILVNLRNRAKEERRRQTMCDKRDNNFAFALLPPNFTFLWTDLFVEEQETLMLSEFPTKHASNSPVTFVTLRRFVVLFFLPSCCVNS